MSIRHDRQLAALFVVLLAMGVGPLVSRVRAGDARQQVALLNDPQLGTDAAIADAAADALRRAGFGIQTLGADAVCNPAVLSPQNSFLLVIPQAARYPAAGAKTLTDYLSAKGNLVVLGRSPLDTPAWKHGGQWVDKAWTRQAIARQKTERVVFGFDQPGKARGWGRAARTREPSRAEVVAGGAAGSAGCLRIDFRVEGGLSDVWDAELNPKPDPRGGGLFCFWAKGDGRTPQLLVRLSQGPYPDRGIAIVPLESEWKYYVLTPDDFRRRGQADPFKARRVGFEFTRHLTPMVGEGTHTVWIDQMGLARNPLEALGRAKSELPMIETIAPDYKTYPLADVATLKLTATPTLEGLQIPRPASAYSCYARPEGKGFERGYKWRWIPLIRATDAAGIQRGAVAWMLLYGKLLAEGPAFDDAVLRLAGGVPPRPAPNFQGAACAVCGITDPVALKQFLAGDFLGQVARRIRDGLYLDHAGADQFSYWPGEKARLGAVVVNHGVQAATVEVRTRVRPEQGAEVAFQAAGKLTVEPGQSGRVAFEWTAGTQANARYLVTTELFRDGQRIDVIEHGVGVLSTAKPRAEEFVTVRDGDFWLEGKRWYPMGVNYWPRHAIALECEDYTYHWLTPGFYNPEEVERDLQQLESMGSTFVAIRAHHQNDRRTVLDFLRRARAHGIRTMLFLQSHEITDDPHYFQGLMMPYHFQTAKVVDFLRATRLADNPALLGYDLIWEPAGWVFGGRMDMFGWKEAAPYRQRWDEAWGRWINARYGSVANAEADWGVPAPRQGPQVTSPSETQLRVDGPSRVMVAAYRRFMEDLMCRFWNDTSRKLRALDPNHLLTYRQGNLPPIDFTLTPVAKHVDFFCMEGYSFQPGAAGEAAAGFVNRYVHFVTHGKPYLWVEFGGNAWDLETMQPTPSAIDYQGQCHELIYRVALANGARGASPWWLAGGYRVSERSDFGILNPDGTPRPAGRLLAEYAKRFRTPRAYPAADTWFTADRDAHNGGQWYLAFHEGAEAYRAAAAQGKNLGIRSPGTGSTSASVPLVAVGNTQYTGRNPPKYLDAEFNRFRIKAGDGPWVDVTDGAQLRVPRGARVVAQASVGNLQEATWLAPGNCQGRPGGVYLASTDESQLSVKQPIRRDTPYFGDADFGPAFPLSEGISVSKDVVLQMTAEGRAWFGEKLRFTLLVD
jgi:hypothetical protein